MQIGPTFRESVGLHARNFVGRFTADVVPVPTRYHDQVTHCELGPESLAGSPLTSASWDRHEVTADPAQVARLQGKCLAQDHVPLYAGNWLGEARVTTATGFTISQDESGSHLTVEGPDGRRQDVLGCLEEAGPRLEIRTADGLHEVLEKDGIQAWSLDNEYRVAPGQVTWTLADGRTTDGRVAPDGSLLFTDPTTGRPHSVVLPLAPEAHWLFHP